MKYTRDEAICMAFYVDFTEENVIKYKKKIEELENFDVCWNLKENEPVLVSLNRIRGDPLGYKRYPDDKSIYQSLGKKRKAKQLVSKYEIKQFLNQVFLSKKQENSVLYSQQTLATKDIYEIVQMYTSAFRSFTAQAFATWCRDAKIDFLGAKEKKGKQVTRELSVLREQYRDQLVESITEYLPKYQASLQTLVRNGIELVGYARKSPTDKNIDNNIRLVQSAVKDLKKRSFTSKVFISLASWATTPLAERDLDVDRKAVEELEGINGTTQDMLEYINSCDHDICLVSIGFAGLTSRSSHLVKLIEDNPAIKKIAIETYSFNSEVYIFDAQDVINNREILDKFDYCNK